MIKKDYISELKEIILKNNINLLQKYIIENELNNSSNLNDFKNLIIYAIENLVSNEIVLFLFNQRKEKNANFGIKGNNRRKKIPLFLAIEKDNYILANILINSFNADINYIYMTYMGENQRITEYLYHYGLLTPKRLNYVLEKGAKIDYKLLCELIKNKENKQYELLYNYLIFNNDDILQLLCLYKRYKTNSIKDSFSNDDICKLNDDFKHIINANKSRQQNNEKLYEEAMNSHNDEAIRITFENDMDNEFNILNRIVKYDLFKKSLESRNYNFVKKVLSYKPLHYMCSGYEDILISVINNYMTPSEINKKENIAKLVIEYFIATSYLIYKKNESSKSDSVMKLILNVISNLLLKNFYDIFARNNSSVYEINSSSFRNLVVNIAIRQNNFNTVKYLCKNSNSEEICTKDLKGEYPIFTSVECGNDNIFEYLIKKISNPNIKNNNGISILTLAIIKNRINIVEYLLKHNNNLTINEVDSNGFTPLENAINQNNDKIVHMILNYGINNNIKINIGMKDYGGNFPLIKAINKKNFEMTFSIINYANQNMINTNIQDENGNTPLILSYKNNDLKIFNYLLEYYNINQTSNSGNTILHYAIFDRKIDVTKQLLIMGANLHLKNDSNNSPMDVAFNYLNSDILKAIIQYGNINVNIKNKMGDSLLTTIIKTFNLDYNEKKELVELLINKGVNVNILDKEGRRPLYYARFSKADIFNLLKENGAY